MRTVIIVICGILFLIVPLASADIYRYIDENGVECYTDTPFDETADKVYHEKSNYEISRRGGIDIWIITGWYLD